MTRSLPNGATLTLALGTALACAGCSGVELDAFPFGQVQSPLWVELQAIDTVEHIFLVSTAPDLCTSLQQELPAVGRAFQDIQNALEDNGTGGCAEKATFYDVAAPVYESWAGSGHQAVVGRVWDDVGFGAPPLTDTYTAGDPLSGKGVVLDVYTFGSNPWAAARDSLATGSCGADFAVVDLAMDWVVFAEGSLELQVSDKRAKASLEGEVTSPSGEPLGPVSARFTAQRCVVEVPAAFEFDFMAFP